MLSLLSTLKLSFIKMQCTFFEFLRKTASGSPIFTQHNLKLKVSKSLWWIKFQKLELLETTKKVYLNCDWIPDLKS